MRERVGGQLWVERTAREAVDRGCGVITLEDGCAGASEEAHRGALRLLRALGEVQTVRARFDNA
ncbi:MAG: isochorismatase family protein [Chloroflexota bacterium]|nr:cysteine hydrolase [Dehalococcoidia bacterium]MDW8254737.1 isochorismatase family protein [Chloroflexota bacterium]